MVHCTAEGFCNKGLATVAHFNKRFAGETSPAPSSSGSIRSLPFPRDMPARAVALRCRASQPAQLSLSDRKYCEKHETRFRGTKIIPNDRGHNSERFFVVQKKTISNDKGPNFETI
jgi:hypothetical protein